MAVTGNGTTGYIGGQAISPPTSVAFHCFYRNTNAPAGAVVDIPISMADSAGTYFFAFHYDHTSAGARQSVSMRESAGTYKDAQMVTALLANTWYGVGGNYSSTAGELKAYLNGALEATVAAAAPPTSVNPTLTALATNAGTTAFDDGTICEVAFWNASLDAADFNALGKGVSPLLVKPHSLVAYWPLISGPTPAWFGPNPSSVGGISISGHFPGIIYPDDPQILRFNGTEASEWQPVNQSWSSDLEMEVNPVPNLVSSELEMGSIFTTNTMFDGFSSSLRLKSRFRSDSGYLASGRFKDRYDRKS